MKYCSSTLRARAASSAPPPSNVAARLSAMPPHTPRWALGGGLSQNGYGIYAHICACNCLFDAALHYATLRYATLHYTETYYNIVGYIIA